MNQKRGTMTARVHCDKKIDSEGQKAGAWQKDATAV